MPPTKHRLRKFRFDRPQQIAALLLLALLAQCLWVIERSTLSESDYQYARCGREMWERPSPLAGYFTTCGNIHDGTLAYRAAGLPLTLDRILAGQASTTSTWEMRHELSHINLLLRMPFVFAALMLGGCLWWVTRRLYGNTGGYIALTLYCFSPPVIAAAVYPNNEIWAAFGLFAAVYTAIGVSHAMQGPRKKWRPRIILLTVILGFTAAAHVSAFVLALVLAICFMAYLAEGKRAYLPTLLIVWVLGAMLILFASYAFRPDAFSYVFRSEAAKIGFSFEQLRGFFSRSAECWPDDCRRQRTRSVPGDAAITLLRQHGAVDCDSLAHTAGDPRSTEHANLVGGSVSPRLCGRSLCRRARNRLSSLVPVDHRRVAISAGGVVRGWTAVACAIARTIGSSPSLTGEVRGRDVREIPFHRMRLGVKDNRVEIKRVRWGKK